MANLEDIVGLAKRRGFIYQSSEIYGGLAGVYDYGPLGAILKRNLQQVWWDRFITGPPEVYGLDAAILMNPKVWEASGHVAGFTDPLVECGNCHSRLRADHIEGDKCPVCGKTGTLGEPRQFNMMLKTMLGTTQDTESASYLRPETAQGIFINYKNIIDSFSPDMPFGIGQIGKAFRNEISPRDWLFRQREFEQMELQYFIHPSMQQEQYDKWRGYAWNFLTKVLNISEQNLRWHEHGEDERAHYAAAAHDIEFNFPFGFKELWGIHNRTDYDLKAHQEKSGKNLAYQPKDGGEPFIPFVIESSVGLDRLFLAILTQAYTEDEVNGENRLYLNLPASLAPVKAAVFPLLKNKPELTAKAQQVYDGLRQQMAGQVMWDDNGNIGKRYRRQDEIGTPYCITVDFQTLEDDTVTVRDRNTTEQSRQKITELSV